MTSPEPSPSRAPAAAFAGGRGWILRLAWVAACLLVGGLGGLATSSSVRTWYPTLEKPAWNPPAWLFGPVWTALYVAMGVAAARVHARAGSWRAARPALDLFAVQLALNGAWSALFFGARSPLAGLVDIVLLLAALLLTLRAFARVDRVAAWLLVPYAGWVAFATALNLALWRLNA